MSNDYPSYEQFTKDFSTHWTEGEYKIAIEYLKSWRSKKRYAYSEPRRYGIDTFNQILFDHFGGDIHRNNFIGLFAKLREFFQQDHQATKGAGE